MMFEPILKMPRDYALVIESEETGEKAPEIHTRKAEDCEGFCLISDHESFILEKVLDVPIRSSLTESTGFHRNKALEYLYPGYQNGKKVFFRWTREFWHFWPPGKTEGSLYPTQETEWVEMLSFEDGIKYYFETAEPKMSAWLNSKGV